MASGAVPLSVGIGVGVLCAVGGFGICAFLGRGPLALAVIYVALQLAYNFRLKRAPVADVFLLASGYVLRAALGAAAIHVAISGWLLFCTGALALLVGIGKRRAEFLLQEETGIQTREALNSYSLQGLDLMLAMAGATAMMSYGIYSIESQTAREHPALMLTSIWVLYAVFRYVFLVVVQGKGDEPETLLFKDRHILMATILFVATAAAVMQFHLALPILDSR